MHENFGTHQAILKQARKLGLLNSVPMDEVKRRIMAALHLYGNWHKLGRKTGEPAMKAKYLYGVAMLEVQKAVEAEQRSVAR